MLKKTLQAALALVLLVGVLSLFKPIRVWASTEGSYIYHTLYLRATATTARPACSSTTAGAVIYDSTINSIAFCDGTSYHKLVTGSGANDYWTSY
jgi:hypothetical protein